MADLYDILGSVSTSELVGGNSTRTVHQIFAISKPGGVNFSFIVVPADFAASHVQLIAHDMAVQFNKDAAVDGVTDLTVYQDVNNAGQFVDKADVTVESTSGNSSATYTIAYNTLFGNAFPNYVAARRADLDEIEGL